MKDEVYQMPYEGNKLNATTDENLEVLADIVEERASDALDEAANLEAANVGDDAALVREALDEREPGDEDPDDIDIEAELADPEEDADEGEQEPADDEAMYEVKVQGEALSVPLSELNSPW